MSLSKLLRQCEHNKEIRFTLILNANQDEINLYFLNIELPANISLVSRQTNLIPYYQQTSLLLNLSRVDECIETFGLTLIEKRWLFGIPVIAPPEGGPTEIITEGMEGYFDFFIRNRKNYPQNLGSGK